VRVFLYSVAGIPLLIADGVLLYTLAPRLAERFTPLEGLALLGGASAYAALHLLLRKPERMYLWGHELTHLAVAKLFLRDVHGFHITSRSGGKVVIDRTNVAIDLAPYAIPLYNALLLFPAALLRGKHPYVGSAYLGAAAFLFTMHLHFSADGFLDGQPDVRRSGRVFSAAVVLLSLLLWLPCLAAPVTRGGFRALPSLYRDWAGEGMDLARMLLARGLALYST
jgi:hypothetical protein